MQIQRGDKRHLSCITVKGLLGTNKDVNMCYKQCFHVTNWRGDNKTHVSDLGPLGPLVIPTFFKKAKGIL